MQSSDPLKILGTRVRCYHDSIESDPVGTGPHRWIDGTVMGVDGHLVRLGSVVDSAGKAMPDQVISTRHGEFIRFEIVKA